MPPGWATGIMPAFRPRLEKRFARAGAGQNLKEFKI
jgi:hypothetical protein